MHRNRSAASGSLCVAGLVDHHDVALDGIFHRGGVAAVVRVTADEQVAAAAQADAVFAISRMCSIGVSCAISMSDLNPIVNTLLVICWCLPFSVDRPIQDLCSCRCNGSLHIFYSVLKYRNKNTTSRRKCQYLSATFLRFLSEFYSRLIRVFRAYLKTQTSYINCTKSKNAVE